MDTALNDVILTALYGLGDTPNLVAANLLDRNCKGRRNSACGCPVANYVNKVIKEQRPDLTHTLLTVAAPTVNVWAGYAGKRLAEVDLPEPVREFVYQFDRGNFRELASDLVLT